MTQQIKFDELRRKPAADLIFIRAILAAGGIDNTEDGIYNLEFKIQGKEVDFKKFCESFEKNFDAEISDAANKKLNEMADFTELREKLDAVRDAAASKLNDIINFFNNK